MNCSQFMLNSPSKPLRRRNQKVARPDPRAAPTPTSFSLASGAFFGWRQHTVGNITLGLIRSRYRSAILSKESSKESDRKCGFKPRSMSLVCFAL